MAEAKDIHDFEVGIPVEGSPNPEQQPPRQPKKNNKVMALAAKEKKVARREKLVYGVAIAIIVLIAIATIRIRTQISEVTLDVTKLEATTTSLEQENKVLNQEISELSRASRVKEIAGKQGLSLIDENIRTVKP